MIATRTEKSSILVVDPRPNDYGDLVGANGRESARFQFCRTGRAALGQRSVDLLDLCIINTELPDMSGFDLYESLQPRLFGVPVVLIADDYTVEDELRARTSGVTIFACKPLQANWLRNLQPLLWDYV